MIEWNATNEEIKLIARLCEVVDDYEYERKSTGHDKYEDAKLRLKDFGEAINVADGFVGMQFVAMEACKCYSNAANTLNYTWDGVGDWRY